LAPLAGCQSGGSSGEGGGSRRPQFVSLGTAPVGGTFPVVGGEIAKVLNAHKGENAWKVQAKGTKGSQENIRRLAAGDLQLALSNASITYFAVRGEGEWDRPFDVQTVMTLAPNVGMFITKTDKGIKSLSDLKGKRVVIGPAGAGFEMFVGPILEEHGVSMSDIQPLNATQSGAVDLISDGSADAAFLGGAVPASSITQAASSFDAFFIPYDEEARQRLADKYPFFHLFTIPAKNRQGEPTYRGMKEDFPALNVGSMHLITSADQDEEMIYQTTKTLWDNREAVDHPAARFINEENAARDVGTPFHPGALRFYQEIGIIEGSEAAPAEGEVTNDGESGDASPESR
jgi:uncharacterized protein